MRYLLITLALVFQSNAWAGGCYRPSYSYSYPSYSYPSYYSVPVPIATYFTFPLYSVGYTAPVVTAPASAAVAAPTVAAPVSATADPSCEAKAKALEARLVALEKLLSQPRQPEPVPAPQPPQAASGATGRTVFAMKCAACHSGKENAEAKGGKFVMFAFNGQELRGLSARDKLKIIGKVNAGTMPPRDNKENIPPLTDQEVADAISYLDAVPTAEEAPKP